MSEDHNKKVPRDLINYQNQSDIQLMKEAKETDDTERLKSLATHPNIFVRGAVAQNTNITPEIVDILSKTEPERLEHIIKSLDRNPKWPELNNDEVNRVIDRIRKRLEM